MYQTRPQPTRETNTNTRRQHDQNTIRTPPGHRPRAGLFAEPTRIAVRRDRGKCDYYYYYYTACTECTAVVKYPRTSISYFPVHCNLSCTLHIKPPRIYIPLSLSLCLSFPPDARASIAGRVMSGHSRQGPSQTNISPSSLQKAATKTKQIKPTPCLGRSSTLSQTGGRGRSGRPPSVRRGCKNTRRTCVQRQRQALRHSSPILPVGAVRCREISEDSVCASKLRVAAAARGERSVKLSTRRGRLKNISDPCP